MAQGEAMDTSFSNGEERDGAESPSPHNPEASADSMDCSASEQNLSGYQAVHDAIVEAAQVSGELQPLTEVEMERRSAIEGATRQLCAAEVQREKETCAYQLANLPPMEDKERKEISARLNARLSILHAIKKPQEPTYDFLYDPAGNMVVLKHYAFGSMDPADGRVVSCDAAGEPLIRQATHVWQLTRGAFGAIGLVPDDATARIVVITASERGTMQYLIDCYDGKSPLVTAVETPSEGGDRTVTPYLADWSRSGIATDEMDRSNPQDDLDLLQGNGGVVQAA